MKQSHAYDIADESAADVIQAITESCAIDMEAVSFAIDDSILWLHVDGTSTAFNTCHRVLCGYFTPV